MSSQARVAVAVLSISIAAAMAGCEGRGVTPVTQGDIDDRGRLQAAQRAVQLGEYQVAESVLADYVYRTKEGELKLRYWGVSSKSRKLAIDVVSQLLWETGRDDTSLQFADDYLSGDERKTVHCRVAERQKRFDDASACWNEMGQLDRSERVIRTKAALQILGGE